MSDDPEVGKEGTELTRAELLRRAGVGAAAIGVAGTGASKAFGSLRPA